MLKNREKLTISLPIELKAQLVQRANEEYRTLSGLIEMLVIEYLNK